MRARHLKNMSHSADRSYSPWPHRAAVALVCAVFPLIWVGGLVTTYGAGMAVPDWPTTYGYNLFLYPWQTWLFGPWDLFIEHGHRLLGALAGMLTIVLVVVTWRHDPRHWVRWLSVATLAAVVGQGVLGGMRVQFDARLLAMIHACTGPAYFALCVALAAVTSRRWFEQPAPQASEAGRRLQRLAVVTTLLSYLQLLLGAQLRHVTYRVDPSQFQMLVLFHVGLALVVTVHVVWLAARAGRLRREAAWLVRPALGLAGLIAAQLLLGAGTWISKYGWPAFIGQHAWTAPYTIQASGALQSYIITGHVAVGSLIVVTSLLIALRGLRLFDHHRLAAPSDGRSTTASARSAFLLATAAEVAR